MVTRLIDTFKSRQITAIFTSLTSDGGPAESSDVGVSSQMDAWLLLRNLESNGERNRGLYVLKSRGMAHSNQIREFVLTDHGVQLLDVYVGPAGLLTGSARIAQAAKERAEQLERKQLLESTKLEVERKREQLEAQIARLRAEFNVEEKALLRTAQNMKSQEKQLGLDRIEMGEVRKADAVAVSGNGRG
jgi:circadian clock protein KaiC